jgi:hypothetical protein
MNFIDHTYFINDINIPGNTQSENTIKQYIERYENEILKSLLGYELWKELIADLNSNYIPQTPKFVSLVDGAEFSFDLNGKTINTKWEGIKNTLKISLISYYVYYQYRNQTESYFSGTGQVKPKKENAEIVDARPKIIESWNKMIELYGEVPREFRKKDNYMHKYCRNYWWWRDYYFGYYFKDFFFNLDNYIHFNEKPSAYNYLLANKDDFSNWIFDPKFKVNLFGL